MLISVPISTRIYLKKILSPYFCIVPGSNPVVDIFCVLYDVYINDVVVIPSKSTVTGTWTTSTSPIYAKLTITSIIINNISYKINGVSSFFTNLTSFESAQIENANSLSLLKVYKSTANISRRLVNVNYTNLILYDEVPDTTFVIIPCYEIVINLTSNFNLTT